MYISLFNALNHALGAIKQYQYLELCITTKSKSENGNFYIKQFKIRYAYGFCIYYNDQHVQEHGRKWLMRYFLKRGIIILNIYGSIGINYVDKVGYHYKYIAATKIQKAWNRYRIRTARIRNDLVIHGLAEYFFHPSRVSFEIV